MSLTRQQIESTVSGFISREILKDSRRSEIAVDQDLLTSGMIDSLGVMRLVAFIESEFSLSVPPQDVIIENFLNISAIAAYVWNIRTAGNMSSVASSNGSVAK